MDGERYVLQVYVGSLSRLYEALSIEASKTTSAEEIVECIAEKLALADGAAFYELAEVMGNQGGQDCKERRLGHAEYPVALQLLWPKKSTTSGSGGDNGNGSSGGNSTTDFKFALRRKLMGNLAWSLSMSDSNDSQLIRDYFYRFIYQPRNSEYPDLCQLPDLTDQTLLENLKVRRSGGGCTFFPPVIELLLYGSAEDLCESYCRLSSCFSFSLLFCLSAISYHVVMCWLCVCINACAGTQPVGMIFTPLHSAVVAVVGSTW